MTNSVLSLVSDDVQLQIAELQLILPLIWSRESSGDPAGWTPEMPSYMQCIATSELVHADCGGSVLNQTLRFMDAAGEYLYYPHRINLIKGVRYDLTAAQLEAEVFDVVEEFDMPDAMRADHRRRVLRGQVAVMVDTLFTAYNQRTGKNLAAR